MPESPTAPTDRRALLAGIGGLAAGTFLAAGRAEAGPLTPPGPPSPTGKPLAEVEPRIPISAANTPGDATSIYRISQPGSYYLTGNVSAVTGRYGISIAAHGVTLDLMGFALLGDPTILFDGINVSGFRTGLVIRNGSILNWGSLGIRARMDGGSIENIHFAGNRDGAFRNAGGFAARVAGCTAYSNGAFAPTTVAIFLGEAGVADGCVVRGNQGTGISGEDGCQIINCSVVANVTAGIRVAKRCIVHSNIMTGNGNGIEVTNEENRIEANQCISNTTGLLITGVNSHVEANVVRGNTTNYSIAQGNHLNILLSQIPQTIPWPASVKLAGSLTGVSGQHGISIASSNVTIDLNGHSLIGVEGSLDGIRTVVNELEDRRSNYIIRNGSVSGWGGNGINTAIGLSPLATLIEDVNAIGNGGNGIRVGNNAVIRNCTATTNGSAGFRSDGSVVIDNCAARTNSGGGFVVGSEATISSCMARTNTGAGFQLGDNSAIRQVTSFQNTGIGILCADACTISDSTSRGNTASGISANSHCVITRCVSHANNGSGIATVHSCLILENQCSGNGITVSNGSGILAFGDGNRIERNNCQSNRIGIKTLGASFVSQNTCKDSTQNNWEIQLGSICLALVANFSLTFQGNSGGASPGSTNPNANYSF